MDASASLGSSSLTRTSSNAPSTFDRELDCHAFAATTAAPSSCAAWMAPALEQPVGLTLSQAQSPYVSALALNLGTPQSQISLGLTDNASSTSNRQARNLSSFSHSPSSSTPSTKPFQFGFQPNSSSMPEPFRGDPFSPMPSAMSSQVDSPSLAADFGITTSYFPSSGVTDLPTLPTPPPISPDDYGSGGFGLAQPSTAYDFQHQSIPQPAWATQHIWHAQRRSSQLDEAYSPTSPQIFSPTTLFPSYGAALEPSQPVPSDFYPSPASTAWQQPTPIDTELPTYLPHHVSLFDLSPTLPAEFELPSHRGPSPAGSSRSTTSSSLRFPSVTPLSESQQCFTPPTPLPADTASSRPPTPQSPKVHPAAEIAAAHRIRLETSTSPETTPKIRRQAMKEDNTPDNRRSGRIVVDNGCCCERCGCEVGKLTFRGTREELAIKCRSSFVCLECAPLASTSSRGEEDGSAASATLDEAAYADTLSAAVDRLQGIQIAQQDIRSPPVRPKATPGQSRKRRNGTGDVLVCDVCTRDIASGGIEAVGAKKEIEFGIEVICARCSDRYARCTDCGGGGGPRIGVGKWRSKELFPLGRRTCLLSHLRLGSLDDMTYDVWPISDLPGDELDEVNNTCRELYFHNMYAGLATPEVLEPVLALAKTYNEVKNTAMDSWAVIEPMLRSDPPVESNIRRYLALRWTKPAPRKKGKCAKASATPPTPAVSLKEIESKVMRQGKNLAGFVLAELDLASGSLFLAVTTPWANGDTYDATTLLMQNLLARVNSDILSVNSRQKKLKLPLYPALDNAWLMMFFKKESRLVMHLENRRNFLPLEAYLDKFPKANVKLFAPHRAVYMPSEFLKGWNVYVRKIVPNDDWNARATASDHDKKRKR